MSQIDKLRKQIDKIDFQILDLLKKRSKIAENIGKEKKSNNLFRPERQASILRNILKKNGNNLNPSYILSFWRSIFLSQIDVQGGIKLILLKEIANLYIKTIYDYFSHDIEIIIMNNTSKALEKVYNGKNILTILPYPSNNKGAKWWTNKRLEKLYAIATLPFFLRKKSPSLIIVSKYKPVIEKDSYFLYISKYLIKDKNTVLISKSGKHYLYRSNNMIKNNDLKLFGILPKHYEG